MTPSLTNTAPEIFWLIVSALRNGRENDYIPALARLAASCRRMKLRLGNLIEFDARFQAVQVTHDTRFSMFRSAGPACRKPSLLWFMEKSNDIDQITACIKTWKSAFPDAVLPGVAQYPKKTSPGHVAIRRKYRSLEVLQLLVREGFPVTGGKTSRWIQSNNLLMYAIEKKQDCIALWLINQGAEFDHHEVEACIWENQPRVLAAFLRKMSQAPGGISSVLGDRGLENALQAASNHTRRLFGPHRDGKREIIDLLVKAGASLSNTRDRRYRPLYYACQHRQHENALRIFQHQMRQDVIPCEDLWDAAEIAAEINDGLGLIKAIHPKYTHLMRHEDFTPDQSPECRSNLVRHHLIRTAATTMHPSSKVLEYLQNN